MRFEFTNNAPMSAAAVLGVCAVSPVRHVGWASLAPVTTPAAVSPLTARRLPMLHQDQVARELILTVIDGSAPVQGASPSAKLGGYRGVPPRRRPAV
jgi:hypothetical protein